MTTEERFWSKTDQTSDCWIWTASTNRTGYGQFGVDGTMREAHRVAYELTHGPIYDGRTVDHICRNRVCVRPSHLRLATAKQQQENVGGARSDNKSSGIRGVTWDKSKNKWQAAVQHNGIAYFVGRFPIDQLAEAEAAVIAKRLELFTHNDADRALSDIH